MKKTMKQLSAVAAGSMLVIAIAGSASAGPVWATVTGHQAASSDQNHADWWESNAPQGLDLKDCTKIEPGGKTYELQHDYELVVVKAGSAQSAGVNSQTLFAWASAGETVWADSNGSNAYDSSPSPSDKDISHIILCDGSDETTSTSFSSSEASTTSEETTSSEETTTEESSTTEDISSTTTFESSEESTTSQESTTEQSSTTEETSQESTTEQSSTTFESSEESTTEQSSTTEETSQESTTEQSSTTEETSSTTSFESSEESTTESTTEQSSTTQETSSTTSFESSEESTTDSQTSSVTQPPTDTIGNSGTGQQSSGLWMLLAALGVLAGSVLVLSPSKAKSKD